MAATIKSKMQKMLEEEAARRGVKKSTQSEKEEPVTKRKTTSTSTKAGTTAPAFGVLTNVSDRTGFAEYNKAKSFAEYSAMRKKQEEAEGMRRAADQLGQMYGYKNVAGKAVYATPFSPLPNPAGGRGATKAQAPGAYGIAPGTYVQSMKDVAAYMNMKQPSYDNETQAFLDKYFGGNIPTAEQFDETYQRLYSDFSVPDEDVSYFFHKGAELVGKATNEQEKYKQELTEAQAGYDAAVKLLGEDAAKYLGSEAEYFERYGNTYGAGNTAQEYADYVQTPKRGIGNAFEKMFGGNDRSDLYTFNVLNEGAYTNFSDDTIVTGSMLAAQNMTPNQRKTYLALAGEYGESAAEAYYEALLRDGGFNKQAYEMRNEALRDAARENWFGATAKTFLTAPAQIAGSLYAIKQGLTGQEIDPYNTAFAPAQATQTPREQVLQDKTKEYGKIDEETGEVNDTLRSVLFRGAYSAGTSFADSMIANMLGGGIPAASSLLQGGMQMGGDVQDVKLRGGTDAQALALGGISALIEAATEYIPADNLIKAIQGNDIKTIKELGWNVAKSILGEAPGEGLSELGSAAADRVIMGELSEWQQTVEAEGAWAAAKNLIKNVGEAMLAGAISGGAEGAIGGTAGYIRTRNVQKELEAAAQQYDADQKVKEQEAEAVTPHPSAAQTPSPQGEGKTPDVRDALLREYTPETAQVEPQQAGQPEAEQEQAAEEKPAETASEGEKEQRFTQARGATVRDEDGVESRVRVVGVKMNEGTPLMVTENENGETDYATADELTFDDEMGELLGYEGIANMDAKGLRSYLEGWDGETAAEDYARAYAAVYQRASAGLDYEQAAMQNEAARRYLTEDARMSAYAAGQNAYNQTHNTVKAAEIVNETAETGDSKASNYSIREEKIQTNRHAPEAHRPRYGKATLDSESNLDFSATKNPDNRIGVEQQENAAAPSSAQDAAGVYGLSSQGRNAISSNGKSSIAQSDTNGKLSKRYKTKKWNTLTLKQKNNAVAQMEVMAAFASRTGHTIVVVDSITGSDGQKANATYNPDTHEITVALDATEGAYAYAAMHELTHAMRNEHADEWDSFVDFVRDGLKANGQNWDELVAYQMDRFGYDEATAEEEVICNTVPALLQDERNVLKLYKGNRTLFERVVDWVKGLLKDVKAAGEKLSTRSQSWAQMDALKNDRELLQGMYDRLMAVMEKQGESKQKGAEQKLSANDQNFVEDKYFARQMDHISELKPDGYTVVGQIVESSPLNMVGIPAGKLYFDNSKIQKAIKDHGDHIDGKVMQKIPQLLEQPIVIAQADTPNTVNVFGYLYYNDTPILVGVMIAKNRLGTASIGKIRTVHARRDTGNMITDQSVLYLNPNKKETTAWFQARGNVVPLGGKRFGFIRSIAENGENVKFSLRDTDENVQDAMTAQQAAFQQVRSHRITAAETDKLAGEKLSTRSQSWAQMDALKNDRELLQGMYDRLMAVMEKPAEASDGETRVVKLSAKDESDSESQSLKEQLRANSEAINRLPVVASVRTAGRQGRSDAQLTKEILAEYKASGFEVERQGFGKVSFGEREVDKAVHYANNDAEYAAILAAKKVVKRGIEINERRDHKGRRYDSTTFAAPVEVNGKKGMEAVLVKKTKGNRFSVARILAPDGSAFVFEYKKDAEPTTGGGRPATEAAAVYTPISPASDNSIAENGENVKFSMRDTDENVQDAMTAQQKAFQQVRSHRITAAEADKLAGLVLKESNSTYDRQKLAGEISRIFDYIERGEDINWNQVDDELSALSARVMEKSRTLDLEHEEMAKPIRDYLRKTGIRLTESQRREAESLTGSYGAYRKALFGRVRLNNTNGMPLDSLWSELTDMAPELFPTDASEGEMAAILMHAVDALKPVYHTGKGMNVEESASWLAGKLNEAYFSLPAVKAAAQNARTFGDSIRDLKTALKRFEETSWTEYQSALRSIKEARTAETRTRRQKEIAALRAKYQNWRDRDTAARKERELKAKYRAKIERTTTALTNWLYKPTDAKHVPAGVEDSVRRMIASLDFSGKDTKVAGELSTRINSMADALLQAQEGEDENRSIFLERDQQMIDELRRVAELIRGNTEHQQMEGRGVYDLNGMELRELSKWLDVVRHVVTEASKLRGSNLPGESVEQVAAMSMQEISQKKAWKDKKWATKQWNQLFGPDMQDSFTFFERLGSTTNAIFMELRRGFDKVTQLTRQAEEYTKTILKGVNLKELTGKKAKKQTFNLQKGGRLEMTKAQIMELYVLNKREQAQGHIYGEGIRIQGDEDARPRQLTKADVATITGTLTEEEKRVADGLQKFLSRECASWGNETSMKLLGYRKFGEEYYWPIRTDSNTRNTTRLEDNYAANISAIKNQGMTKATIEGAKNAIVVSDIFDTYTKHISNMAAYAGYALPLSDFTRWYNSRGVKTEIEQVLGTKGLKYINNFLMAVNGSALREEQSGAGKLAGKFSRNAKIASVGGNIRVVVQQPTSYARAAMYMSPKYLSGALTMKKPSEKLVNHYCGIAQWKRWGFYETNIGPNLRQMIVGDETVADRARELFMKPAAAGDDWTLNHLWNACELETRELYPELARGSEEYYQQVGARMSEIIDRTQVVDSVFHRSQMMRSKNAMDQMLTNFMSEPTKTYNMLMSAISDYADNRRNKAARNRVARAFMVYAVTGLLTAAAAAVVDAIRDDDTDKEWAEKYLSALGSNTADHLNPVGLLPGVKDVLSLLEGYEPSRLDQQSIQRIIWAAQEVDKYIHGESKQNLYGVSYKVMQAVSSVLGIPLSNLMRDGNAIYQTVTGDSPTLTAEARKNSTVISLFKAMTEGNKTKAQKLRAELSGKVGMTPKEIDTALAKQLANEPKVQEAWEAKSAHDYATMNRARNALTAMGFGTETVDKAITLYGNSVTPKETKEKDPNEQLSVTLYTEEEVVSAMRVLAGVEKGGSVTEADVRSMISERVAGSTAADPEKTVKSGIQLGLKKEYLAMEVKGNTAGMRKLASTMKNLLGTTEEAMSGWVIDQHADNLRAAVDKYNSKAALKAVDVMRKDGKTDSQIKSSLSKYKQLYIDAVNRRDTATANKIKNLLKGLGLKGKNGKSLYTDEHFAEWLKEK